MQRLLRGYHSSSDIESSTATSRPTDRRSSPPIVQPAAPPPPQPQEQAIPATARVVAARLSLLFLSLVMLVRQIAATSRPTDRPFRCKRCRMQFNSVNAVNCHQNKHRREKAMENVGDRPSRPPTVQPAAPQPPQPQEQTIPATTSVVGAPAYARFLSAETFSNWPAVAQQQPMATGIINPPANSDGLGAGFRQNQRPMDMGMAAKNNKGKGKVPELERAVTGGFLVPGSSNWNEKVEVEEKDDSKGMQKAKVEEDEGGDGVDLELRL